MDENPQPPPPSAGEQLDGIMRDLDQTGAAWKAAGYPYGGPEWEAREAVFLRLTRVERRAGEPVTASTSPGS